MPGSGIMWTFLSLLAMLPVWFVWLAWDTRRRRRRGDAVQRSTGGIAGFDQVWQPTADEARAVWEAEQITPAPAPTPDEGPGVITGNRIVIDTGLKPRTSARPRE